MLPPVPRLLVGSALAVLSAAQTFEAGSFNGMQALLDQGINVFGMPKLAALFEQTSSCRCSTACSALSLLYSDQTVEVQGEAAYSNFTGSYWSSIQSDVQPCCIFFPPTPSAVSVVVTIAQLTSCPFAVKSGGHAAFAGASSSPGGITVSLQNLNSIRLATDSKTVAVEPGQTWHTVYSHLAAYDLAVIGGRVSSAGVGGLTLGGGISFFSNVHGWACDNVASYQVVTADSRIVTASPTQHQDLYWALRGGGNNFGIVVEFVFETISLPRSEMWGGSRVYLEHSFLEVTEAFAGLVADSPSDPKAGLWVAWLNYQGTKMSSTDLWYTQPNGGNATIFSAFNNITAISDATQNLSLTQYTDIVMAANVVGKRECYYVLTVKASVELLHAANAIFFEEMEAVLDVEGAAPVMVWQGITEGQLRSMKKNGGNPLGLTAEAGPFYMIQIASYWDHAQDDTAMYDMMSAVLTRVKAKATSLGVQEDYVYMNYGSQFQDVIASYGLQNKARLKDIASRYDPREVFQILQPGYFKLDRAPVPDSGYLSF